MLPDQTNFFYTFFGMAKEHLSHLNFILGNKKDIFRMSFVALFSDLLIGGACPHAS